jgi:hypothetical protein
MTQKEIKSKSKQELEEILIDIYASPYIPIYFSIKDQLKKLAEEIEGATINLGSKDYDHFLKWGEKAPVIAEGLKNILSKIDPATLREEQKRKASAEDTSVESYIGK